MIRPALTLLLLAAPAQAALTGTEGGCTPEARQTAYNQGYVQGVEDIKAQLAQATQQMQAQVQAQLNDQLAQLQRQRDADLGTRMRAYLVLRPDAQPPTLDEVKAHVRTRLERYKSPREVVFVAELPHNPSGKLQRFRLPDLEVLGTAAESDRGPETDPVRSTS